MIRVFTASVRSTSLPINLRHLIRSKDAISRRALSRTFHSYPRPFPPYEGGYQAEPPYPRNYVDHQFHPGVNSPDSRLGDQFRGEYARYHPVRVSWRGYGPECYCRCCGRPFWGFHQQQYEYRPVNFVGGNYGAGVNESWHDNRGGYPVRSGYSRSHSGSGFNGSYERYHQRNPNGNDGQQGQNLGDSYYDRQGVLRENMSEEQEITQGCYSYRQSQCGGRDGRDRSPWSQSRSNYNQYGTGTGTEHRVYQQSGYVNQNYNQYGTDTGTEHRVYQQNGYVNQIKGKTGNQTRLEYNGGSADSQPRDATVNERPVNTNGTSGEFQHSRQSQQISDVLINEKYNGSHDRNQNVETNINYNQAGVWVNHGHQNLNRPHNEHLNGFKQNHDASQRQNSNAYSNGGQYPKRFNAANIGEPGGVFKDDHIGKEDSVNVGYQQSRDGSNMSNLYSPRPGFTANDRPLKPNLTNADNNQMPNINDSRNDGGSLPRTMHAGNFLSHGSNEAAGRCQRIIDVLETEDKRGPKGPGNRFISQSGKEYTNGSG